ncbi:hypothetical protein [Frondihabitans australicus]|uniref:Bacterial Ig domain-containing protein n=1 Tax=Frondihabitans australicus TaxID=386892 RepID=A0A495IGR3_9MICO|nr:hypothetical protein [Frondihabitans australicus]RKR74266.1 hypothetical protein C8E83_1375 [Frondihabitans australicus]
MKKSLATAFAAAVLVCAGLALPGAATAASLGPGTDSPVAPATAATTPFAVTSPVTAFVKSSRTPVFAGTAPAGSRVEIRGIAGSGPALAVAIADTDGSWSAPVGTPFTTDGAAGTVVATSDQGVFVTSWTLRFTD